MLYRGFFLAFIYIGITVWSADLSTFNKIKSLYELYGNDKYMINEEITQRSHCLQAALIAKLAGAPEDVIIGLLLHDIGQLASKDHLGDLNYLHAKHDEIGSAWLIKNGIPDFVCDFAHFHTIAKVVLCMENTHYFNALSLASKESYVIQRNKYLNEPNQLTLQALLQHPRNEDIKHARRCDDMAKILGLNEKAPNAEQPLPSFEAYEEMFLRVCEHKGLAGKPDWKETIADLYDLMVQNRSQFECYIKSINN